MGTDLGRGIGNSLVVSLATVAAGLVICAMAAFALAAIDFPGRSATFSLVILSFLIPFDTIAIPLADLFRGWNLQNTYLGLVLPGLGNGMAIFLIRTFFFHPEGTRRGGTHGRAGLVGLFRRIYLPLARPALIGASLILFLFQWQSYVWPLLMGTDAAHVVGPVALANMQGQFNVDYGLMFAGSMVLILIPLALIVTFQPYFIQSVTSTGIK
jgi:putative chitobiose transport system permease protein